MSKYLPILPSISKTLLPLIFVLSVVFVLFNPGKAFAATKCWDGGGATNNYSEAANWAGDTLPTATSNITFHGASCTAGTPDKSMTINSVVTQPSGTGGGMTIGSDYAGTITQSAGVDITFGTLGFTQAGGTYTGSSGLITIQSGGDFAITAGTFTAGSGTIYAKDDWSITGSPTVDFTTNTGTVRINGQDDGSWTVTGTITFYNLNMNDECTSGGNATLTSATLTVNNTLTIGHEVCNGYVAFVGGTINAKGDISTSGRGDYGTTEIIVNGSSGNQTITGNTDADAYLPSLTLTKTANTIFFASTVHVTGNFTNNNSGTTLDFTTNTSTVNLAPSIDQTYDTNTITGSTTFYNLSLDDGCSNGSTSTIASGSILTVNNTLTFGHTQGCNQFMYTMGPGTIIAKGDISYSSNGSLGDVAYSISGTGTQTITEDATANIPTGTITINKTSGSVALATSWNLETAGQDLTVSPGANFTLSGAFTLTVNDVFSLSGTMAQTTATISAGTYTVAGGTWNNSSTGDVTVGSGGVTNNGQINFGSLASCGGADNIAITSSSGGSARTWTGIGRYTLYDIAVTDLTDQKGAMVAWSSTNNGNNTGIHFQSGCPTPPMVNLKLDEGTGTTTSDSSGNSNTGTLAGSTIPTWQQENLCVFGKCLYFDGSSSKVTVATTVTGVQSIGFWVKPASVASKGLIDLDGGTHKIVTDSGGVISATGFTSPTIYINGRVSSTLAANQWQYVEVTTGTSFSASAIKIGFDNTNYTQGFFDEFRVYNYARSAAQVAIDYNLGYAQILAASNNQPSALSNGLVGYWKMDESATPAVDSSGNGNSGTWTGNVAATTGKFGNGTTNDGTGDYLAVANSTSLQITGAMTMSAWVNPTTLSNGTYYGFMGQGGVGSENFSSWVFGTDKFVSCRINSDDASIATSVTAITTGSWYHIACVYVPGVSISVYINGKLETTTTTSISSMVNPTQALRIGSNNGISSDFNGKIDEARVYNRALSGADIATLYNFAPGPVGYWKFEEGTGSSVADVSSNANTGTWNGTLGSQWTSGKYGKAGNFNGSNNYTDVGKTTSENISGAITVSAWVKAPTLSCGSNCDIVSNYDSGGATAQYELMINSSNQVEFDAGVSASYQTYHSTTTLTAGTWYFLSATRNSTNTTTQIYINGTADTTTLGVGPITIPTSSFGNTTIGRAGDFNGQYWNGQIDDVKIYNYARTPAQIIEDMNAGHPAPGSPVGTPLGYWKFNEGADNTCSGGVNDACNSGNGGNTIDGAQTNMAVPATATSGWNQAGKFGKALTFDGSNDYVDIPVTATVRNKAQFSFSAWVNPAAIPSSSSYSTIYYESVADLSGTTRFGVFLANGALSATGTKFVYSFRTGTSGATRRDVVGATTPVTGSWYHIAATYDSDLDQYYIYVNGKLDGTLSVSESTMPDTASLAVNVGRQGGGSNFFNGTIDEVKLYSQALTPDQIKLDMNQGSTEVLGALSDKSTYQPQAANQEYCVPGDTASCVAPVLRYDFEEGINSTAFDSAGNGDDGTFTTATYTTTGKQGKAANFNATSGMVEKTSPNTAINNLPAAGMTVEAWIYPKSLGENSLGYIVSKNSTGTSPNAGWIFRLSATNSLTFTVDGSTDLVRTTATSVVTLNAWNHVAVYWDGVITTASSVHILINGLENGGNSAYGTTTNGASRVSDTASPFTIGNNTTTDSRTFDGYIDSVRVFNYARTTPQVNWDYNRGGPVGWWKMDECQGTTINDSSGNSYTGTLSIGATGTYTTPGNCTTSSASSAWYNGRVGKRNYSMAFDGTDDYVNISSTIPSPTNALTLSAWIKRNSLTQKGDIVAKYVPPSNDDFEFIIDDTGQDNKLCLYIQNVGTDPYACSTGTISDTNWHHVVTTRSTDTIQFYIDGVLSGTTTGLNTADLVNTSEATTIGAIGDGTFLFSGQIDDARIYNYALTATQVKTAFDDGAYRTGPVTGAP